MYQQFSITF